MYLRLILLVSRRSMRNHASATGQHRLDRVSGSRSSKVFEIQKRLNDYERRTTYHTPKLQDNYAVESIIAEQQIQTNTEQYAKLLKRREALAAEEKKQEIRMSNVPLSRYSFPFAESEQISFVPTEPTTKNQGTSETENVAMVDRGFYVEGDIYFDEYRAGTILDLPEDEMTRATAELYGPEDAVEHIEFQLPGQNTEPLNSGESDLERTWMDQFGTMDPERPESHHSCNGCGANFHCKDASLPGFVPLEIFEKLEHKKKDNFGHSDLCKRCHLLKHHNFLLNVNVCPVNYMKMMSHLKMKEEALILLIADVTDLPGSIHRQLPNIIGERKPMIVVGNKVDLLPPDARCGYLKRFKNIVEKAIEEAGYTRKFNVLHTGLISAKTGYGVEDLITQIHMNWTNARMGARADIYLVGCTNTGKSTLFNAFLQSDLCKVRAVDLVERATTSVWPGTTISLLKFPIMKVSPYRLELRRRRLLANRAWQQKENYMRKLALQKTHNSNYAVLTGLLQNTYKDQEEALQPVSIKEVTGEQDEKTDVKKWSLDDPIFTKGNWCYDTPGTVNDDQLLSVFTLSELIKVLPRRLLRPRTAIIKPGNSLVIGGVAVVDVLSTENGDSVLLTTFASDDLPLNILATKDVEKFLNYNIPKGTLVVPNPDPARLEKWPPLDGQAFEIAGSQEGGSVDLVLSSIGWVLVNSIDRTIVKGRVPIGKGVTTREPLLPFAADLKGKRIPGTPFYEIKSVEFPVNERRQQALSNRRKFKGS